MRGDDDLAIQRFLRLYGLARVHGAKADRHPEALLHPLPPTECLPGADMEPWQPQPAPAGSANFRFNDYCPNRNNVNPNRMKSVPPAPYAVGAVNHAVAIGDARFAVGSEERRVGKGWVSPCRYRWSPYH